LRNAGAATAAKAVAKATAGWLVTRLVTLFVNPENIVLIIKDLLFDGIWDYIERHKA
jgi:hypothetical protein